MEWIAWKIFWRCDEKGRAFSNVRWIWEIYWKKGYDDLITISERGKIKNKTRDIKNNEKQLQASGVVEQRDIFDSI